MTFCIAAPDFSQISETFIRDHVRSIAPDETILVCRDGSGTDQLGCPVLSDIDQWPAESSRKHLMHAVRHRWRRYVNPSLWKSDHVRVRSFLEVHHAKAMLAEYGPMGCLLARTCSDAKVPLYV